ncbi:MAG: DUF2398 family protein, partial [Verrucomicrobiota bacterium]
MPSGPRLTRAPQRRRERLTELESGVDPIAWEERRMAVRTLLAQPLLVENTPARALIRRHEEWLQLWFSHHVGWKLSI